MKQTFSVPKPWRNRIYSICLFFCMLVPQSWSQTDLPTKSEPLSVAQLTPNNTPEIVLSKTYKDIFSHYLIVNENQPYQLYFISRYSLGVLDDTYYIKKYALYYRNKNNEVVLLLNVTYDDGKPQTKYFNDKLCNYTFTTNDYNNKLIFDGKEMGLNNADTINFIVTAELYKTNFIGYKNGTNTTLYNETPMNVPYFTYLQSTSPYELDLEQNNNTLSLNYQIPMIDKPEQYATSGNINQLRWSIYNEKDELIDRIVMEKGKYESIRGNLNYEFLNDYSGIIKYTLPNNATQQKLKNVIEGDSYYDAFYSPGDNRYEWFLNSSTKHISSDIIYHTSPKVDVAFNKSHYYEGDSVYIEATANIPISKWEWTTDNKKYYVKNPRFIITRAGTHAVHLKVTGNEGQKFSVEFPDLAYYTVLKGVDEFVNYDFPAIIYPNVPINIDLNSEIEFDATNFILQHQIMGVPEGASLQLTSNSMTGTFKWDNPVPGSYNIKIESILINVKNSMTEEQKINVQIEFIVPEATYSNVTFNVVDGSNKPLADVPVYLESVVQDKEEIITDQLGQATTTTLSHMPFTYWAKYQDNVFGKKRDVEFNQDTIIQLKYTQKYVIENVCFEADACTVVFNEKDTIYTFNGNTQINNVLFFMADEGDDDRVFVRKYKNYAVIETQCRLATPNIIKGIINPNNPYHLLLDNNKKKELYLQSGLVLPRKDEIFDIGEYSKVTLDGYFFSFYRTLDGDNSVNGIEFMAYPQFPWIIGEYVQKAGVFVRKKLTDFIIKYDNQKLMAFCGVLGDIGSYTKDKFEESAEENKTILGDSTLYKIYNGFNKLSFSIPDIKVIKRYDDKKGVSMDMEINNFECCLGGVGLKDVSLKINKSSIYKEIEVNADFILGEECKSSEVSAKKANASQLVDYDELPTTEFDLEYIQETMREMMVGYPEMEDVDIIVKDNQGVAVYQTTYDDFIDLNQVELNDNRFASVPNRAAGLKNSFSGFGFSFKILNNKIDSLQLRLAVEIYIAGAVKLSNANGALSGLTSTNPKTGKTKYSTDNMKFEIGCDLGIVGVDSKKLNFPNVKLEVKPPYSYKLGGDMFLFNKDVFRVEGEVDAKECSILMNNGIKSETFKGILNGRGQMALTNLRGKRGAEPDLTGVMYCNIKLPEIKKGAFEWASGMEIGGAALGVSTKTIGGRITIGRTIEIKEENLVERGIVKDLFKKAVKAIKNTIAEPIETVTKSVFKKLSFDVGIGYDLENNEFLFGENVKFPAVKRIETRNGIHINEYEITSQTKLSHFICSTSKGASGYFRIYNPSYEQVAGEALWTLSEDGTEMIASIINPSTGTWCVEVLGLSSNDYSIDVVQIGDVPTGYFESPMTSTENETTLEINVNSVDKLLMLDIYRAKERDMYVGELIQSISIQNNARVRKTVTEEGLFPGEYFFYYVLTDTAGIQSRQYAPGSLIVPEKPTLQPLEGIAVENHNDSLLFSWTKTDGVIDYVEVKVINPHNGQVYKGNAIEYDELLLGGIPMGITYDYEIKGFSIYDDYTPTQKGSYRFVSLNNNPP